MGAVTGEVMSDQSATFFHFYLCLYVTCAVCSPFVVRHERLQPYYKITCIQNKC